MLPKTNYYHSPGPRLNIKTVLSTYGDFHLKIRRPLGRLIFNMGIAIPGKTVFLIETAPWLYYSGENGFLNSYRDKTDVFLPVIWKKINYLRLFVLWNDWKYKHILFPKTVSMILLNLQRYCHHSIIAEINFVYEAYECADMWQDLVCPTINLSLWILHTGCIVN